MTQMYCFRCGKTFKTKKSLLTHLKEKNVCEVKFMEIDRETFADNCEDIHKDCLNEFMALYNGNKSGDFECEKCHSKFQNEFPYVVHIKNCNGEPEKDIPILYNQGEMMKRLGITTIIELMELKNKMTEMSLINKILALKNTIAELEGENKLLKYKLECQNKN